MLRIDSAISPEDVAHARTLFSEYAAELNGVDLEFQGFAQELETLPGAYAPPRGCLLLARHSGSVAGCIALRPIDETTCEMKRMYVRPKFRKLQIGSALAQVLVAEARRLGYERMRLDTLPTMRSAIRLYESLGFERIAPYYDTPVADTVFMELELARR